jgi:hypothetical protein
MVSNEIPTVLLNAFSLSMLNNPTRALVEFRRLSPEELRQIVQNARVESYIRHNATVQVLNELLQVQITPNNGIYSYNNERIIVVALGAPQRGQEVNVRLQDLVIYEVVIHELE